MTPAQKPTLDRTTKALLLAIAVGLWANVLSGWLQPVSASAQGLSSLESIATDIQSNVGRISRGTCTNSKIC